MSETLDESRRLAYLQALGVTQWIPRARAPTPPAGDAPAPTASPSPVPVPSTLAEPRPQIPTETTPAPRVPDDPAGMDWPALEAAVSACRRCALCETRTRTVFGVGNRKADLMVIGEAPGADEDRAGEPFVGRAGRLLDLMLESIALPRPRVFIANILKCRPPGNRDPKPEEILRCQGYLVRQIELIRPRVILAIGRISAQSLLHTDAPVGRLRGRWLSWGDQAIPLRVSYHPAYLLRSPEQKAKAWEDLVAVARKLAG